MLLQATCISLKNTARELFKKAESATDLAHIKSHIISANSIMKESDLKGEKCVELENLISEALKKEDLIKSL